MARNVAMPDGRELTVGLGNAFRTEQAGITSLNYLAMNADSSTPGTLTASRLALTPTPGRKQSRMRQCEAVPFLRT
jgi:hypothetical protein